MEDLFESIDDELEAFDVGSDEFESSYGDPFYYEAARTAEILPFLGPLIGAAAPAIGGAINNLIRPPARAPLQRMPVNVPGRGVSTASLATPAGTATIRMPEAVVSRQDFEQATQRLQTAVNNLTTRQNTLQNDVRAVSQRVGTVVAETQRDITRNRTEIAKTRAAVTRLQRENQAALTRMRREQSSQNTTNMMISMMMSQRMQSQLNEHVHPAHTHGTTVDAATSVLTVNPASTGAVSATTGQDNSMLMLLPMMMGSQDSGSGGSGGSGGDNNMMMMMMMMMAFQ